MTRALLLAALLAGCPAPPRVSGCAPGATRCHDGYPERCSPERRWYTATDRPCGALDDSVCCLAPAVAGEHSLHTCAPEASCLP